MYGKANWDMSAGNHEDNSPEFILIDATKNHGKKKRKEVMNSKKGVNRKKHAKALICVLCGLKIPFGGLLKHKELIHGEKVVPRQVQTNSKKSQWIKIVQGGLPSLGKRK